MPGGPGLESMDERLLHAVGHDLNRLNIDPSQRDALIARHGLQAAA